MKIFNTSIKNIDATTPIILLDKIFSYVKKENINLYILIDEYDNFANKLLLSNKRNYEDVVSQKTASFK